MTSPGEPNSPEPNVNDMKQQAAIDIDGLWFAYNHESVLRDVHLRVDSGELVCMVGPNGGGKTTLLKLLLGLLNPSSGRIRVLGRSPQQARAMVGYVPQHARFDPKFPVSVSDVVLMGLLGRTHVIGPPRRADRQAAADALAEVELADLRGRPFAQLSGGQRQRTLIARSLVASPKLLLLDEPTTSLDAGVELGFYSLLERLAERMTIVMVSHDVGFVSNIVGKVVCVRGTVAVHPTEKLTGEMMRDLYGVDIRLVRHDHNCLQAHQENPGDG